MATNLAIDDRLLEEALLISGFKTKRDMVNYALREFINRRKQLEVIELFGSLEPGAWSLEPGAWSLEPGAWSLMLTMTIKRVESIG